MFAACVILHGWLCRPSQLLEVRDVRIRDCAARIAKGTSKKQVERALLDYECWLEFEVLREG